MVPYLSWLERAVHNRIVDGSSPSGTTKEKIQSFPVFITVPPRYDHSQVRVMHEDVGSCPMYYSAILLSLALKIALTC